MSELGRVFEIQRCSLHDGPGIRTTVFLQGCPLHCVWCHNPEGIPVRPLISFQADKCVGCGHCFNVCPHGAHAIVEGLHVLDHQRCEVCGTCLEGCYARAMEGVGRQVSVAEVLELVRRDQPFYQTSGGGLTLSGGEPTLQFGFVRALLQAARAEGLHCCVETCGFGPAAHFAELLPLVDLFLFDLKETDEERHRAFTGVLRGPILENLRLLHDRGGRVRLRLPLVPGYNARPEHFAAVAELARSLPGLEGVELMPYHRLGTGKLERLGLEAKDRLEIEVPDEAVVEAWVAAFAALGVQVLNTSAAEQVPAGREG
ncbi:MAG: glycyl-radical enzyme activating protein [Candidatus Latescibacteria bacterium]|nr:glycyl-radical enzyme activating protein [Candidatus Latescibacterota bacterium]